MFGRALRTRSVKSIFVLLTPHKKKRYNNRARAALLGGSVAFGLLSVRAADRHILREQRDLGHILREQRDLGSDAFAGTRGANLSVKLRGDVQLEDIGEVRATPKALGVKVELLVAVLLEDADHAVAADDLTLHRHHLDVRAKARRAASR